MSSVSSTVLQTHPPYKKLDLWWACQLSSSTKFFTKFFPTKLTDPSVKFDKHWSRNNNSIRYLFVPLSFIFWNYAYFISLEFQLLLCCVNISISIYHATCKCQSWTEFIKVLLNNFLSRNFVTTKINLKRNMLGLSFSPCLLVKKVTEATFFCLIWLCQNFPL